MRGYSPKVFADLRSCDGISCKDYIESLDPILNLKDYNMSLASGGRSGNPIIFTHDKKYLIKTISKGEKNAFVAMLSDFHKRLTMSDSFLCRIYGLFRVKLGGKRTSHIIIMRNMNNLTSYPRVLTFDLKGSTVDRSVLKNRDLRRIDQNRDDVIASMRDEILKDNDLRMLDFKFNITKKQAEYLVDALNNDFLILKNHSITDYSLLVNIHEYQDGYHDKIYRNFVSQDNKYVYNFSIIDFLTVKD